MRLPPVLLVAEAERAIAKANPLRQGKHTKSENFVFPDNEVENPMSTVSSPQTTKLMRPYLMTTTEQHPAQHRPMKESQLKIAKGDQINMQELINITGTDISNIYLSLFEQPLYMESQEQNQILSVTVEIITKDDEGRLLGAVRGKDNDGNHTFTNVWYDTAAQVWKINHTMNDMIEEIEEKGSRA